MTSGIETAARDDNAPRFEVIANTYDFPNADLVKLIATREW